MFTIFKDKEFYEELWEKHTSDNLKNPIEFNLEAIDLYDPKHLYKEDLYLLYLDEEEGILGKVTFSHSSNNSAFLINFDHPLTDSALLIKNIGYHIYADSNIQDEVEEFEALTHIFYQSVLKNALWICHKLSIKDILTISEHIDDHKDLSFWGGFKFLTHWESRNNIIGIVSCNLNSSNQPQVLNSFLHNIKCISYDELL